jgi:hypothetical protein
MDSYKLAVKLFLDTPGDLKTKDFIPVFHRWIQTRALEGHQLIDVADYGHVHQGPGTVLVSHEANFHADTEGGRLGLFYIRKYAIEGSFANRLQVVFTNALKAAALLEKEPALAGKIKFRTDQALFQINDRLNAPNTPETFAQIRGDVESFLSKLYGVPAVELTYHPDPQRLFEIHIRSPKSIPLGALLDRLATL